MVPGHCLLLKILDVLDIAKVKGGWLLGVPRWFLGCCRWLFFSSCFFLCVFRTLQVVA